MMGNSRQGFQHQDEQLQKRLIEVFSSDEPNMLIGIADNYGSLSNYSSLFKNEIRYYMTKDVREGHAQFLQENRTYANAYMTTPYMAYNDKETDGPTLRFNKLKNIWDKRNLLIVEGALSRLGVSNDLFENAASIRRILCPPEHAFDKYNDILKAALTYVKDVGDNPLILVSLGPTATVLAYDLYKAGYQALDIGHIDNDYEYYLNKATDRYAIPGKYVNNLTSIDQVAEIYDEDYKRQIICTITNN